MVDICCGLGDGHWLKFTPPKSKCGKFSTSPDLPSTRIILKVTQLDWTNNMTYLTDLLRNDLSNDDDVFRVMESFNRQTNLLMSRFRRVGPGIRSKLFTSFCSSVYWRELWGAELRVPQRKKRENFWLDGIKKALSFPKRSKENSISDGGCTGIFQLSRRRRSWFCEATFTAFKWNCRQGDEKLDVCIYFWLQESNKYGSWRGLLHIRKSVRYSKSMNGGIRKIRRRKSRFLHVGWTMSSITSEWIIWRTLWETTLSGFLDRKVRRLFTSALLGCNWKLVVFLLFNTTNVIRALFEYSFLTLESF